MPRGVRTKVLTLLLAAIFAISLAACGGSDDSTTGATTAPSTPSDGATSGKAPSDEERSGDAEEGSSAFVEPGGDNSIQNYGEEAEPSEREAAEKPLAAYMAARAKEDWATACRYLGETAVKPLEEFARRAEDLKGKDCSQLLTVITGKAAAGTFDNTFRGPVASLRVKDGRGFALYHGTGGVDYFMLMAREGGQWKVAAISPTQFPG